MSAAVIGLAIVLLIVLSIVVAVGVVLFIVLMGRQGTNAPPDEDDD
jgi:flagellar basal body-associated protein FliL